MEIKVSVIGKRGQARKHINNLLTDPDCVLSKVLTLNKEEGDLPLTNNLHDLFSSDAIIISSPTPTHFDYLSQLKDYPGYLLIEKPVVSRNDVDTLLAWPDERKARIRVNFTLPYTALFKEMKEIVDTKKIGDPVLLKFHTSQGLAQKKEFKDSWRANEYVLETVGSHYLNLASRLLGGEADFDGMGRIEMTITGCLVTDIKDIPVLLSHSYNTSFLVDMKLLCTGGYWTYDGSHSLFYAPTNTFNAEGRFTHPPIQKINTHSWDDIWAEGFLKAWEDFKSVVQEKKFFSPQEFDRDVKSV